MTAAVPGVEVEDVTVRYGSFAALQNLSLTLPAGQIVGVVGPNGAGKTTLLNAISGFTEVADGRVLLGGREIQDWGTRRRVRAGLVRGFQTVRLMERETVLQNVMVGVERHPRPTSLTQLLALPRERRSRRTDRQRADRVIALLRLASVASRPVNELPFAARRLVEVGRVLIARPDAMLLDEPAAGLDRRGRRELASVLRSVHDDHQCTVVIVEHDIEFVSELCTHVVALDAGRLIHVGTPAEVFGHPRVQLAYFGRQADDQA